MTRYNLQHSNAPSLQTLIALPSITPRQVLTIRGLMKGQIDPETILPDDYYHRLLHPPSYLHQVMEAINSTLGTFGVEHLKTKLGRYEYCKTDDSYGCTVVRCMTRRTWLLTSWADIAEREGILDS